MKKLYDAFLKWREDSGMDNQVADHLEEQFTRMGLKNIVVDDRSEDFNSRNSFLSGRSEHLAESCRDEGCSIGAGSIYHGSGKAGGD